MISRKDALRNIPYQAVRNAFDSLTTQELRFDVWGGIRFPVSDQIRDQVWRPILGQGQILRFD